MKKQWFGAPEDIIKSMCWLRDKGFTNITLVLTSNGWYLHCGYRWKVKTQSARDKTPEDLGFDGDFVSTYYTHPSHNGPLYWWIFD